LDDYLRGIKGNSAGAILWNNLLYGMDPPGLDVRLSLDLYLQARADDLLAGHHGAVILMNAESGEILVMASHPTFDPSDLTDSGQGLLINQDKPLINRATQGQYPSDILMEPFIRALYGKNAPITNLANIYEKFGFYQTPQIQLPVAPANSKEEGKVFRVSPLQMVLASAALSNRGIIPAPRIAMAVNTPSEGWVALPALGTPIEVKQVSAWEEAVLAYLANDQAFWRYIGLEHEGESSFTWFIGGTPPNWQGAPLALVVIVEEENIPLVRHIGNELLIDALSP
jgi:cell division protein FtsI/penicillin-binding protein 2